MSAELTLHGRPARYPAGLQPIGPGTYAWLQPNGEWGESNAGLVVGDGAALLVDTLWDQRLTRRMLAAMGPALGEAPIATVVNTHSDGDHWWGNAEVGAGTMVTSRRSAELMDGEDPAELVRFRRLGNGLGRVPVGGARDFGRFVAGMLGPFAFGDVTLARPNRVFEGEERLDAGGREVRLIEVGPAHTPGDLIVWVPDVRAVFAADVLFIGTTPVMWAGPVGNWLAALDRILALEPTTIVPGHGPLATPDDVRAVGDYWRFLDAAARPRFAEGRSPAAAAREIALSDEFAAQPFASWLNPERIVINVTTLFREYSGSAPKASPVATVALFRHVAALGRELEARGR